MNRRKALLALCALVVASVSDVWAQNATRVVRIGYLAGSLGDGPSVEAQAFVQGLRELGYVEGRNLVIEYRDAGGKPDRLPTAAAELVALGVDVILAPGTQHVEAARQATRTIPIVLAGIVELAARNRFPGIYPMGQFVDDGGLMSYSPNVPDNFRRAAGYVDKIPKSAKPADLPIEQSNRFELVVNRRTADALGIAVPAVLLQRADRVIDSSLGRRVARVR